VGVRPSKRVVAITVVAPALGLPLALGLAVGPASAARMDYTASQILIGPPFTDHALGQVAADKTLSVSIQVTAIDDAAATGGEVEITVDLSEVSTSVDVVSLSPDCLLSSPDAIDCTVQLAADPPPVPVATQGIGLRARAGTPVGSAGTIHVSWAMNNTAAPTTASIDIMVVPVQTPTNPPTTNPAPTTTTRRPTHTATTPAVMKPVPMKTSPSPSPNASPMPVVTMTPDPTPEPNVPGADPLAGGPPGQIPFANPPDGGVTWRSPALYLSVGTAAAGLLIALVYAVISLRRAGRDPS
jgi:hypothetical protein